MHRGRLPRLLFILLVLRGGIEDGLNHYVFPIAIQINKGRKFALAPLYLESLYARLDKRIQNITREVQRHDVVTHADSSFLQMFFGKDFVCWLINQSSLSRWSQRK